MKRLLVLLVSGVAVSAALVAGMAFVKTFAQVELPILVEQEGDNREITIGDIRALFHFIEDGAALELHVMIVNSEYPEDIMQTRMKLMDGQSYTVMLREDHIVEDRPGHRLTFTRSGRSIIAQTVEAPHEPMIAGFDWSLD
ncbi:MAG: hypothetical protein AAGD13_07480 [Pseudomonadota bacterium]